MAKPMSSDQQLAQFRKHGLKIAEHVGWKSHNRNGHGGWGDVRGLVIHHTGSDSSAGSMESYLYAGDDARALPGPLCQWSIRTDGTVAMIGNGRANHAGSGDRDVYNAVAAESYGSYPPKPNQDNFDGNAVYYGVETQYSGGHVPLAAQYHSMVHLAAAVCLFHGWSAKSVIGHKEHTARKSDPGHVDMAAFRRDVQAVINSMHAPAPGPAPAPKPSVGQRITQLRKRVVNQAKKIKNLRKRLGN